MSNMRVFLRWFTVVLPVSLAVALVPEALAAAPSSAKTAQVAKTVAVQPAVETNAAAANRSAAAVSTLTAQPPLVTVKSDATTQAAAVSNWSVSLLNGLSLAGRTFVPVDVGAFGTYTTIPSGAPTGTVVVNIPPGNGQSGYFKTTFTLPAGLSAVTLSGSANVDDTGRVFLNGNPLTQAMPCSGTNCVTEFGNATFTTSNLAYFVLGGVNTLIISDANTGAGPSGTAFYATVTGQSGADLVETAVSAPPASVNIGASFSVTDTAKNSGIAAAGVSVTRYYLSPTTSKTSSSQLLTGSRSVPALAVNAISTGTVTVSVPSGVPHGAYYLLVCANDTGTAAESSTANNCKASATTTVVNGPDLAETAVGNPPASVNLGGGFSVTDTAKNIGQMAAGASQTGYYLSATTSYTSGSYLLTGSRAVLALAINASSSGTVSVTVPSWVPHGSYYLLACANYNGAAAEANTGNNCKASSSTVVVNGPDLTETAVGNPPASFKTGSSFSVTDTAKNIGQTASAGTVTRYYFSTSLGKTTTGSYLLTGTRAVPALAVNAISTGTVTVSVPSGIPQSTYYLLACANDTGKVAETNMANNCMASSGQATNLQLSLPPGGSLGSANAGQSYSAAINAVGGDRANYAWTLNSTPVPTNGTPVAIGTSGLRVTNTGGFTLAIGGTPTTAGTVTFNVSVKDVGISQTAGPVQYSITVNPAPSYQVSGQIYLDVCGNVPVPPMTVSINTSPVKTTTTNNGQFTFNNVPNGTYTVTPSISGPSSIFSPASQSVKVNGNGVSGLNFSAELGYTVTGSVAYSGSKKGRIYVVLNSNNCGGSTYGTSIVLPPTGGTYPISFNIRGVEPGSYSLQAWMDTLGYGAPNAADPAGGVSSINVPNLSANPVALSVTLKDPSAVTLSSPPSLQGGGAFDKGAVIPYQPITDNKSVELPTSYTVQWSTTSTFNAIAGSHSFPATGNNSNVWILSGLTDGQVYYFRARGVAGSSTSTFSTPIGPFTIGAPTTGSTLSGTVTFPGTATGPLYVGVYDQNSNKVYAAVVSHPVSPQAYSVKVPNSSNTTAYFLFAIIDQNNDGLVDTGDITNTSGNNGPPAVTVNGATTANLTLSNANSTVALTTLHTRQADPNAQNGYNDSYNLNFDVYSGIKLPVAVSLLSGPNAIVPMDVGQCGDCGNNGFGFWIGLNSAVPKVGDAYGFLVTYSDGTTQNFTVSVSTVLSAFATNMLPNASGASTTPTFTWTDPASAGNYIYSFSLWDSNGNTIWQIPGNDSKSNGFSNSITSIPWGTDPTGGGSTPTVTSLSSGSMYNWQIQAQDSSGNEAQMQVSFQTKTLPLSLPTPNPSSLGPATVGQSYTGTINASGGTSYWYFTVNGSLIRTGSPVSLAKGLSASNNGSQTLTISGTPTSTGTVTFTVSVTDNSGRGTTVGPLTYSVKVGNSAPLSLPPSSSIPALVGYAFDNSASVSGGVPPFSWVVNSTSLSTSSSGLSLGDNLTATITDNGNSLDVSGTPNATGTVTLVVTVTDSTSASASGTYTINVVTGPNGANNAYLNGRYVCLTEGFSDSDDSRFASLGSFQADGNGHFTGGVFDMNWRHLASALSGTVTGTYSIGADNNGLATTTAVATGGSNPGSNTNKWAIALTNTVQPAQQFRMVEIDDTGSSPSGQHGTSNCFLANAGAFVPATISGNSFAFGLNGEGNDGNPKAAVGRFSASGGSITNGIIDTGKGGNATVESTPFTGTYTTPNSTTGRYTLTLSANGTSVPLIGYIIDANRSFLLQTMAGNGMMAGNMRKQQQTSYSGANIHGPFVLYSRGMEFNNSGSSPSGYYADVFQGTGDGAGNITINASYMDDSGSYTSGDQNGGPIALTFDPTYPGRATLTPGNGTTYLYLFNNNNALEMSGGGSGAVESGWTEPQIQPTSPPFTNAYIDAHTYLLGQMPLDSPDANGNVGEFTLNGSGGVSGFITTAGDGDFTWDQPMNMTYTWDSTTYGSFKMTGGGQKSGASCIVINPTKSACIINTDSSPSPLILQQ